MMYLPDEARIRRSVCLSHQVPTAGISAIMFVVPFNTSIIYISLRQSQPKQQSQYRRQQPEGSVYGLRFSISSISCIFWIGIDNTHGVRGLVAHLEVSSTKHCADLGRYFSRWAPRSLSTRRMSLMDLPQDVLLNLLFSLDVPSILALRRVSILSDTFPASIPETLCSD